MPKILLTLLFLIGCQLSPVVASEYRLKIATLAPEGSSWMIALRAIDQELRHHTSGDLGLKIYPGGVQGDELVVLRKLRIGQLHGAGFGGLGTSEILPDIRALEMPFLFASHDEVDYVLEQMTEYYREGYLEQGFVLLGWADIGFVHIFSKKPVSSIGDIRGMNVWRLDGEPITAVLFRNAGVTSVPLLIPDVLLGLQTNLIDVAYASPAAAVVLQWFTRVRYLTALPINYTIGNFLVDRRQFNRLSQEYQDILEEVSRKHMQRQMQTSRRENTEALQVIQAQGVESVPVGDGQLQAFKKLVRQGEDELLGASFSAESYDLVLRHLKEFRSARMGSIGP